MSRKCTVFIHPTEDKFWLDDDWVYEYPDAEKIYEEDYLEEFDEEVPEVDEEAYQEAVDEVVHIIFQNNKNLDEVIVSFDHGSCSGEDLILKADFYSERVIT